MKSTKSTGKMEKIKAKWTQVTLKNVLKVKDPKLSRVLIVQNNVYAAVHGTIGEDRLQETCSFLLGNNHTVILTYKKTQVGCEHCIAHVILFTHERAQIKILFITAQ